MDPQILQMLMSSGGFGGGMFGSPRRMFGGEDDDKKKGFNPFMMMSPLGYQAVQHPKYALPFISPGIGIANLLGAFK